MPDDLLARINAEIEAGPGPDAMRWTPDLPDENPAPQRMTVTVAFDSRDALLRAVAAELGPPYAVHDVVLPPLDWTDARSFVEWRDSPRARPMHRHMAEAIWRAGREHVMERYTHRERLEVRINPVDAPRDDGDQPVGGRAYGHPIILDGTVQPGTIRLVDLDLAERDRAVAEARSQGRQVAVFDPAGDCVRVFG